MKDQNKIHAKKKKKGKENSEVLNTTSNPEIDTTWNTMSQESKKAFIQQLWQQIDSGLHVLDRDDLYDQSDIQKMIDISRKFETLYERKKIWHEPLPISAHIMSKHATPLQSTNKKKVARRDKRKSSIEALINTHEEFKGIEKTLSDSEENKEDTNSLMKVNLARYFTRQSRLKLQNEEVPEPKPKHTSKEGSTKLLEKSQATTKPLTRGGVKVSNKDAKKNTGGENDEGGNKPSHPRKRPPVQDLNIVVTRRFKPLDSQILQPAGILTPHKFNSDSSRMKELLKDPE